MGLIYGKRYYLDIEKYVKIAGNLAQGFPERVRKTNRIVTFTDEYRFYFDEEFRLSEGPGRWGSHFTTSNINQIEKCLTPVDDEHFEIYIRIFVGDT